MTSQEMERAIEFLLQAQAKHDAQVAELHDIIREQSVSQSELNQALTQAVAGLADAQSRTDARIDRLIGHAERTDARLDRLSEVVERLARERGGS
jgi:predicted nuclease with TOPRIM domain